MSYPLSIVFCGNPVIEENVLFSLTVKRCNLTMVVKIAE